MEANEPKPINPDLLPFNVERRNNHLELTAKPPKNFTKRKQEAYMKNKVTVQLILFDRDYIEKLQKITPIDFSQTSTFQNVIKGIKRKINRIVLP